METIYKIPTLKLWFLLFLFLLLLARYLIMAGIPFIWFYIVGKKKYALLKNKKKTPERERMFKEITYSIITLAIYNAGIWFMIYWLKEGQTKNYVEINQFGFVYFLLIIFSMFLMHDDS